MMNTRFYNSTATIAVLTAVLASAFLAAAPTVRGQDSPVDVPAAEAPASAPASQPQTTAAETAPAQTQSTQMAISRPASRPTPGEGPISLNFRDASVRTVLEYLSEAAGLVVVQDAPISGRITVMSRRDIRVDEAVSLLDTVLKEKGYAAIRQGRTLKIVTLEQAKKELVPVRSGNDPSKIEPTDRIITQVIPIRYADAVKLKADLAALIPTTADVTSNASSNTIIITGTEATVKRIVEIIRAIDVHMSEVAQVKVFQLKYANATAAAKLIGEIFKEDQPQGQNPFAQMMRGRRAFVMPGAPAADSSADKRGVKVTASADDRTNTLVVSASPEILKVIDGVVKELDSNPSLEQDVFVYRLKNARATTLEPVLNSIFGAAGSAGTTSAGRIYGGNTGTGAFTNRMSNSGRTGSSARSGGTGQNQSMMPGGFTSQQQQTGQRGVSRQNQRTGQTGTAASDLIGQVFIVAEADTNSLLVTTSSKNFDRVREIIANLDFAVPQVLIKVLIAEVTHENSLDLGVEFSGMNLRASGKGFSAGTNFKIAAETTGFMFKLNEQNIIATIRAIAGVDKLDVLSRPYILTGDNQQAAIMVGQEVPFITNTRITDTGQTINTVEYDDIGIILNVTPHINPQGLVTLDVYPEISTLTDSTVPISDTVRAPTISKRAAQSRVAVQSGQTIVIGGLMEDRKVQIVEKVPGLGDIPGIGVLFRRTRERKSKTELLIFLTPHVAQQTQDLDAITNTEIKNTKILPSAVQGGAFDEHMRGMAEPVVPQPAPPQTAPLQNDGNSAAPAKPATIKPAAKVRYEPTK
ncbi:MAG: type II secretion system secretin GspD [Planctomycetaceae bacterium]|nr:type II secretion system secretin GspD [Planctomycetaceae bacterium]